jgi:ABC-type enterobactin transport system permease subunit
MLAMILLQLATLLTAILSSTSLVATSAAGVVASVCAALAIWLQARQHETLAASYALTAVELGGVLTSLEGDPSEADWARLVDEAEEAMSREHTTWQATRFDPR